MFEYEIPIVIKMLTSNFKFAESKIQCKESKIDFTELRIDMTGLKLNFENQLREIEFMDIVTYIMIFLQAFRHNRCLQS